MSRRYTLADAVARSAQLGRLARHREHAQKPACGAAGPIGDRNAEPFAQENEDERDENLHAGEDEQNAPERQRVPELPARFSRLRCHYRNIAGARTTSQNSRFSHFGARL